MFPPLHIPKVKSTGPALYKRLLLGLLILQIFMRIIQTKKQALPSQNIRFFSSMRDLSHEDPNLSNVERLTWTFEDQKDVKRNVTIPQDNNNDPLWNPSKR